MGDRVIKIRDGARTRSPVGEARVGTAHLLRQHMRPEVFKRELKASVTIIKEHLDGDQILRAGLRGLGWSSHGEWGEGVMIRVVNGRIRKI